MIAANRAQRLSAGMLALSVHGLFLLALMFSVSWRTLPEMPVYADLWNALPPLPEAQPIAAPPPEPASPAPPPQPDLPAPAPPAPPPAAAKPDINLRPKPETKPAVETPTQPEAERARQAEEQRRREAERQAAEARRQAIEQARRELDQELDQELARREQAEIAREIEQLRRAQQAQAQYQQSARGRLILEHRDLIRAQIHQHLRPCPKLASDAEVIFSALLLPSGDLKRLQRLQSSGSAACDEDVERAILKAFPIPLPQDREAARAFTREPLELRLRPNETPAAEGRG